MPFYLFHWTHRALEKIAEHGVTKEEFQEVVMASNRFDKSRSSGLPIAFGETSTGKYIACVFESIDDVELIPVTAFEVWSNP